MTSWRTPRGEAKSLGQLGEAAAARYLEEHGFAVVERNLRTVHGEIDLLVRKRRLYAAVEVKTRTWHPAPERLVGVPQLQRLERALRALAPHLRPRPRLLRIDVVAVTGPRERPEVRHYVARGPFDARPGPHS